MIDIAMLLEEPFLSFLVAVGTKPVKRLSRCLCWVERKYNRASADALKFVSGLLLFPFIVCGKLLLEFFIRCQQRVIFLNNRKLFRLYVNESHVELDGK